MKTIINGACTALLCAVVNVLSAQAQAYGAPPQYPQSTSYGQPAQTYGQQPAYGQQPTYGQPAPSYGQQPA